MSETVTIENLTLRTEDGWIIASVRVNGIEHDLIKEVWPVDESEGTVYHSMTGIGMKASIAGLKKA